MTEPSTQDLIHALRTGPAVTLVTLEAAKRLDQLERECDQQRDRIANLENDVAYWRGHSEILRKSDDACGFVHMLLSDLGIPQGTLAERAEAAANLLRWRKQSIEPAPAGALVLMQDGRKTGLEAGEDVLAIAYWRPIGPLPKAAELAKEPQP